MSAAYFFYVFVTLLAMINPIEAAAAFEALTAGDSLARQRAIASRAVAIAGIVLLMFGLAGNALFHALGITFAAFRIAGGLLLLKVAFSMVFSEPARAGAGANGRQGADPTVFPLAIPIVTGPGALTAIVSLYGQAHQSVLRYLAVSAIAIGVLALTYATMRASQALTKLLGPTGIDAVGRVAGIVVAALAVQLLVDGVVSVFQAPLGARGALGVRTE